MENVSDLTAEKLTEDLLINVLPVTIFIGIEAVIGFTGNILILYIYYRWYIHCNFRYFVLFLAIYDFTSCLTTLPGEIFSQCNWFTYKYGWICKIKSYFNVFTTWGSAYTLLLLAFDRYRKICRPLAWQIQPSFALKLCASGMCLSSMMSIPVTILWGKQTYTYEVNNVRFNVCICEKSETYENDIYPFIYISCVDILPIGLMMIAICVLNVLTARKLFFKMSRFILSCNDRDAVRSPRTQRTFSESSDIDRPTSGCDGLRKLLCCTDPEMSTERFQDGVKQIRVLQPRRERPSCLEKSDRQSISDNQTSFSCQATDVARRNESMGIARSGSMVAGRNESMVDGRNESMVVDRNESVVDGVNTCMVVERNGSTSVERNESVVAGRNKSMVVGRNESTVVGRNESAVAGRNKSMVVGRNESICSVSTIVSDGTATRDTLQEYRAFRRKRKTLIMLILTTVFIVTMTLYIALLSLVAETDNILRKISNTEKVLFFFFWRFYFINCVINPLLYGQMDPRFRKGLKRIFCSCRIKNA